MTNKDYLSELSDVIHSQGINNGDIVYIGSDIVRIIQDASQVIGFKGIEAKTLFMNDLIDMLKELVGENGTLLFPTYTWSFCKGIPFDYHTTQGSVGALNNFVLNKRPDFVRTKHPLYSFMVWGKDSDYLFSLCNQEAWGADSPFAYLHKNNAKELDLNILVKQSMTFKHYVEQTVGVPYRHHKYFLGEYTDENGLTETRCYSQYVRDLSVSLEPAESEAFLIKGGACKSSDYHGFSVTVTELAKAFELFKDDILNNKCKNVYSFTDYDFPKRDRISPTYEIGYLKTKELS